MTPKEKAKELVDKFMEYSDAADEHGFAKQCALIAVDEIMDAIDWHGFETPNKEIEYWEEVKQEIQKL